jgi:cyclophilin family peptidyl-prolyl cis-trans isomerase
MAGSVVLVVWVLAGLLGELGHRPAPTTTPAATGATSPVAVWQDDEPEVNDAYQREDQRLAGLSEAELRTEFEARIKDWKHQHARMGQGYMQFYMMKEADSEYWAAQFRDAKKKGEVARKAAGLVAVNLLEKMTQPPDRDLADMVFHSIDAHFIFHEYGKAYRAAKALVERGHQRPFLLPLYGYAAYCQNEFNEARGVFSQAIIAGETLSPEQQAAFEACGAAVFSMEEEAVQREADAQANLPRVEILTTKGPIVVELFEDQAPNTVANFVYLVERKFYRNRQFYDLTDSLIMTGSPTNDASGRVDYSIKSESERPDRRRHLRGTLTMLVDAQSELASSQFAILSKPMPDLDRGLNTVFGRVIEGEIVLDLLERAGSSWEKMISAPDSQIGPPDEIISARVLRKRDREYLPERLAR